MKTKLFAAGTALIYLMLCAGCTTAPPAPPPVVVWNACPVVSLCPMPGSDPQSNGDLSADIRNLERALESCALQIEAVKQCQDDLHAEARQSAQNPN